MSNYIINGRTALRVTSDGRGLEKKTDYNNSGPWIKVWSMSPNDGSRIMEIIKTGPTEVNVITDRYRLQFRFDGYSCNYECRYGI